MAPRLSITEVRGSFLCSCGGPARDGASILGRGQVVPVAAADAATVARRARHSPAHRPGSPPSHRATRTTNARVSCPKTRVRAGRVFMAPGRPWARRPPSCGTTLARARALPSWWTTWLARPRLARADQPAHAAASEVFRRPSRRRRDARSSRERDGVARGAGARRSSPPAAHRGGRAVTAVAGCTSVRSPCGRGPAVTSWRRRRRTRPRPRPRSRAGGRDRRAGPSARPG